MLSKRLHQFLFPATAQPSRREVWFWFALSLTIAALYGLMALRQAFASEFVVQDDARQHVFWMRQYLDPAVLSTDLISSYFRSVAPAGYTTLYWLPAQLGIDPMVLNKGLPLVLGLATTAYTFGISMNLFPVPVGAFLSTLLLNQNLSMEDDLVSATPRAFFYPLFVAFLYHLLKRDRHSAWWKAVLPVAVVLALQGLFYPQVLLLSAGVLVLTLVRWQEGQLHLSRDRTDYLFCAVGLATAVLVLLPYALQTSEFDPLLTVAEARQLPEFYEDGRTEFFVEPRKFWLTGERTGLFPALWKPPLLLAGVLLPLVVGWRSQFALGERLRPSIQVLPQVVVASLGLFAIAHLLLFQLQLPSRYTQHSFRIVMALAAGIVLTLLLEAVLRWGAARSGTRTAIALGLGGALAAALLFYPATVEGFPLSKYKTGEAGKLYQFLQQQPKDGLIASLSQEADNLPSFAQRPVLASREYSIPFHKGYYGQVRQRMIDFITAHYSSDMAVLQSFIQQYNVRFIVVETGAFNPIYLSENEWLMQFQPATQEAIAALTQNQVPALATARRRCTTFRADPFTVIDAACILATP